MIASSYLSGIFQLLPQPISGYPDNLSQKRLRAILLTKPPQLTNSDTKTNSDDSDHIDESGVEAESFCGSRKRDIFEVGRKAPDHKSDRLLNPSGATTAFGMSDLILWICHCVCS